MPGDLPTVRYYQTVRSHAVQWNESFRSRHLRGTYPLPWVRMIDNVARENSHPSASSQGNGYRALNGICASRAAPKSRVSQCLIIHFRWAERVSRCFSDDTTYHRLCTRSSLSTICHAHSRNFLPRCVERAGNRTVRSIAWPPFLQIVSRSATRF